MEETWPIHVSVAKATTVAESKKQQLIKNKGVLQNLPHIIQKVRKKNAIVAAQATNNICKPDPKLNCCGSFLNKKTGRPTDTLFLIGYKTLMIFSNNIFLWLASNETDFII